MRASIRRFPYGYIDELRSILAAGPNFKDWEWARNVSGPGLGKAASSRRTGFQSDRTISTRTTRTACGACVRSRMTSAAGKLKSESRQVGRSTDQADSSAAHDAGAAAGFRRSGHVALCKWQLVVEPGDA